jgi:hypothetical protein
MMPLSSSHLFPTSLALLALPSFLHESHLSPRLLLLLTNAGAIKLGLNRPLFMIL